MENLQKLYNVLTQQGLYTKSYEEFEQQYQDEAYRDKVYNVAVQEGLYTKSQDEFNQQYSLGDTVVSSEEIVEDVEVKDEKKNPDLPFTQQAPPEMGSQPPSGSPSGLTGAEPNPLSLTSSSKLRSELSVS